MKQYQIIGINKKLPDFIFNLIKKDKKCFWSFYKDKKGSYILLRLSHSYIALNKELKERKIAYKILPYDNLYECKMTMKYFYEFVELFHAESMLIHKTEKQDIKSVIERVVHLVHNMAGLNYWEESISLASLSIQRSFIAGSEQPRKKHHE